ncbi:MAG: hypothetical protein ABSF22_10495 [Bryobacteraceae bacterium]|jgi:hypothetical protein
MKLLLLLPYLLIAAGLFFTLAMFVTLKREIHKQTLGYRLHIEEIMFRLNEAESTQRFVEPEPVSEEETAMMFVPAPLRAGLNLSKRVHAMRMLRRGEDVNHIAAALGVPRMEVELMIRVASIGKARAAGSGQG